MSQQHQPDGHQEDWRAERATWENRTRIVLTPIAAPAVLGLFAFGGATWPVAAHLAGWYGGSHADSYLWEFGLFFGDFGQLVASVWSYRARNALGTGLFGLWGFWWVAWGVLTALDVTGIVREPSGDTFRPFGFWFITTGIITLCGTVAALRVNVGVVAVTFCAGTASLLGAWGYLAGNTTLQHAAGADFFAAATFAVYTGAAIMLEQMWHRRMLPIGHTRLTRRPTSAATHPVEYEYGMPGSRIG